MGRKESKIETYLKESVEKIGGLCDKVRNESRDGWPDRLICVPHRDPRVPGAMHMLIETKSKEGKLRPSQVVCHEELKKVGVTPIIINSTEEIDEMIEFLLENGYGRPAIEQPPPPSILLPH